MAASANMPSPEEDTSPDNPGLFFEVDPITPDPQYVDRGNTEMTWTPVLFGFVEFRTWDKFDQIFETGMASFSNLTMTQISEARNCLDRARSKVKQGEEENEKLARSDLASARFALKRNERPPSPTRKLWTSSASILKVNESIMEAILSLLRRGIEDDPVKRDYTLAMEDEYWILATMLGEALRQIDIPEQIRSDIAFTIRGGMPPSVVREKLPLCNFDLKGPTVDLSGIDAARTVHEKRAQQQIEEHSPRRDRGSRRRSGNPRSIRSGRARSNSTRGRAGNSATESSEGASGTEGVSKQLKEMKFYTASEVAKNFNFLFSEIAFLNTASGDGGPIRDSIYRVAQAVVSAILSLGSCSFLFNHQMGIAFFVEGIETTQDVIEGELVDKHKLIVRVTEVFRSDTPRNSAAVMYAIAKHCLDQFLGEDGKKMFPKVQRLAIDVNKMTRKNMEKGYESSHEMWTPPQDQTGPSERTRRYNTRVANREAGGATIASNDQEGGMGEDELVRKGFEMLRNKVCLKPEVFPAHIASVSPDSTIERRVLSPVDENNHVRWPEACKFRTEAESRVDESIGRMFRESSGVLGGSSGVVVVGHWHSTKVAIKMALDNYKSGKDALSAEIRVYSKLEEISPSLLGSVLPTGNAF